MKPAPDAGPPDVAPDTTSASDTGSTLVEDNAVTDTATATPALDATADTGDPLKPVADDGTVEGSACSYGQRATGSWLGSWVWLAIGLLAWRRSAQSRLER